MLVELVVVPVPDAARALGTSDVAVPVERGADAEDDVDVSRTTVLSRPRNSAKSTRSITTPTARIPSTPPGNEVVVVVVVPWVAVRVSLPVTVVPPVVVCGEAVASVPVCGVLTVPPWSVVAGVFVFWA